MANVDIFVKAHDQTRGTLNSVNRGFDRLGRNIRGITTNSINPMQAGLTGLATVGLDRSFALIGASVGKVGKAVVSNLSEGVQAAASFEQQMADVSAILNIPIAQTQQLGEFVNSLALDPKLKVSSDEAAESVALLARNGLTLEQIMGGAARSTVLLANATGAEFGQAADIATDAMALFGINVNDMQGAVDGITGVVNNSKFSINDYALALAQGGGVAAASGVSFDDFNTSIAASAAFFASGSDAGTSYKTFLQRLIPQSNEAADYMRDLGLFTGLTTAEFSKQQSAIEKTESKIRQLDPATKDYDDKLTKLNNTLQEQRRRLVQGNSAFFDAQGNMEDMLTISNELTKATANLSEEQKLEALSTIFGTDALRFAVAMANTTEEEYRKLANSVNELSDAQQSAATRTDTASARWETFTDILEATRREIGSQFLPSLDELLKQSIDLASAVGPNLISAVESAAPQIEAALAGLLTGGEAISLADVIKFDLDDSVRSTIEIGDLFTFEKLTFDELVDGEQTSVDLAGLFTFKQLTFTDLFGDSATETSFTLPEFKFTKITADDLIETNIDFGNGVFKFTKITADDIIETSYDFAGLFDFTKTISPTDIITKIGIGDLIDIEQGFDLSGDGIFTKVAFGDLVDFSSQSILGADFTKLTAGELFDFSSGIFDTGEGFTKLSVSELFDFSQEFDLTTESVFAKLSLSDVMEVNIQDLFGTDVPKLSIGQIVDISSGLFPDGIASKIPVGDIFELEFGRNFTEQLTTSKIAIGDIFEVGYKSNWLSGLTESKITFGDIFEADFGLNFKDNLLDVKLQFGDLIDTEIGFDLTSLSFTKLKFGELIDFSGFSLLDIITGGAGTGATAEAISQSIFADSGLSGDFTPVEFPPVEFEEMPDAPDWEPWNPWEAWTDWNPFPDLPDWPDFPPIPDININVPSILQGLLPGGGGGSTGGGGGAGAQALGGQVRQSGLYNFNEFGQEAVINRRGGVSFPQGSRAFLNRGDTVIPNNQLGGALGGGQPVTVNIYNPVMQSGAQVRAMERQVANSIRRSLS